MPVGADGSIRIRHGGLGTVHVVADVSGYFGDANATTGAVLKVMRPNRIADGWTLSVRIDPPPLPGQASPKLDWRRTLNVERAVSAVEADGFVFVLA